MKIECMNATQWRRVKRLRLSALVDTPDAFDSTLDYAETLLDEDWIKGCEQLTTFVAVDEYQDIGMVRCVRDRDDSECALLISMWVLPAARLSGAGVLLVQSVIDWATHNGFKKLLLDVADDNVPAIALYEKMLFVPTGEIGSLSSPREHIREHRRVRML